MNVQIRCASHYALVASLLSLGLASPSMAFGIDIRVPGGTVEVRDDQKQPQAQPQGGGTSGRSQTPGFSGQTAPYTDDYNGFKLAVPMEFSLHNKGQTTNWIGPILDEGATGIYVNAAPLPGVSPTMLQST